MICLNLSRLYTRPARTDMIFWEPNIAETSLKHVNISLGHGAVQFYKNMITWLTWNVHLPFFMSERAGVSTNNSCSFSLHISSPPCPPLSLPPQTHIVRRSVLQPWRDRFSIPCTRLSTRPQVCLVCRSRQTPGKAPILLVGFNSWINLLVLPSSDTGGIYLYKFNFDFVRDLTEFLDQLIPSLRN